MFGLQRKKKSTQYTVPTAPQQSGIKLASREPPQPPASRNGHKPLVKQARRRAPAPDDFTEGKKDKELAEVMGYLFGNQITLERITDIPDDMMVPLLVVKLQVRISQLTGDPNSDPDLMQEFIRDYMEMEISRNRQGRREAREIITSGIKARQEEDPEANLFGRLTK